MACARHGYLRSRVQGIEQVVAVVAQGVPTWSWCNFLYKVTRYGQDMRRGCWVGWRSVVECGGVNRSRTGVGRSLVEVELIIGLY